jgi:hypothetical protein
MSKLPEDCATDEALAIIRSEPLTPTSAVNKRLVARIDFERAEKERLQAALQKYSFLKPDAFPKIRYVFAFGYAGRAQPGRWLTLSGIDTPVFYLPSDTYPYVVPADSWVSPSSECAAEDYAVYVDGLEVAKTPFFVKKGANINVVMRRSVQFPYIVFRAEFEDL